MFKLNHLCIALCLVAGCSTTTATGTLCGGAFTLNTHNVYTDRTIHVKCGEQELWYGMTPDQVALAQTLGLAKDLGALIGAATLTGGVPFLGH